MLGDGREGFFGDHGSQQIRQDGYNHMDLPSVRQIQRR